MPCAVTCFGVKLAEWFLVPVAEGARIPWAVPMYMHMSCERVISSVPWACGRFKPYQDRKRAPHFSQETEFEHATAVKWTTALLNNTNTAQHGTGQDRTGLRQASIAMAGTCHTGVCATTKSTLLSQQLDTERSKASSKACVARACVCMCYFHSFPFLMYPYTQYIIDTGTGNTKTNDSICFFTDRTLDKSKPRRPDAWCWETVTAAANHVRTLPVPSNRRGNGRTPPGALRELTDQGCTRVGSQPREVRHPVPRPMKPLPKPCSAVYLPSTEGET
jgi:hypothetical protein